MVEMAVVEVAVGETAVGMVQIVRVRAMIYVNND